MADTAPDQTRADFQHLVDRQAKARPNTAYRGSYVPDDGPGNALFKKLVALVLFVIALIALWQGLRLLLQR